jgi:hypothetical protein
VHVGWRLGDHGDGEESASVRLSGRAVIGRRDDRGNVLAGHPQGIPAHLKHRRNAPRHHCVEVARGDAHDDRAALAAKDADTGTWRLLRRGWHGAEQGEVQCNRCAGHAEAGTWAHGAGARNDRVRGHSNGSPGAPAAQDDRGRVNRSGFSGGSVSGVPRPRTRPRHDSAERGCSCVRWRRQRLPSAKPREACVTERTILFSVHA